jgi:hypothetical protein
MGNRYAIQACLRQSSLMSMSNESYFKLPFGYAFWRLVEFTQDINEEIKVLEILHTELVNTRTQAEAPWSFYTEPRKVYKRWQVSHLPGASHEIRPDRTFTIDLQTNNPKKIWDQAKLHLEDLTFQIQSAPNMFFGLLRWDVMINNAVFRALGEIMFLEMPEIVWSEGNIYQPGLDYSLNSAFRL